MSIVDPENFEFAIELTKEQRSDLSKALRDLAKRGRVLNDSVHFAVQRPSRQSSRRFDAYFKLDSMTMSAPIPG